MVGFSGKKRVASAAGDVIRDTHREAVGGGAPVADPVDEDWREDGDADPDGFLDWFREGAATMGPQEWVAWNGHKVMFGGVFDARYSDKQFEAWMREVLSVITDRTTTQEQLQDQYLTDEQKATVRAEAATWWD